MAEYIKQAVQQDVASSMEVRDTVSEILADIRENGEAAIRRYSAKFDHWDPPSFHVGPEDIERARRDLSVTLVDDIKFAARNIRVFAQAQRDHVRDFEIEISPGVVLGQKTIPVTAAGSYTPGGRYPLISSALMTVVTPKVAGVDHVTAMAPPRAGGGIYPATLVAMAEAGADNIYCLGGVQALAALAFGSLEGIVPVDILVGAGNAYVAEAKRQLFGFVGIDLVAGPTEILVLADESADPVLVANDLLGQAEHDPRAVAVLVTTSRAFGLEVDKHVTRLLQTWPTAKIAAASWEKNGEIVVGDGPDGAIALANEYAPEHLELMVDDESRYIDALRNYGSLFIGEETTVAYGDKAIGTNHVLPTMRTARYTGGLWVGKFLKTVTTQKISRAASVAVGGPTSRISTAEGLLGHAITADLRIERYS